MAFSVPTETLVNYTLDGSNRRFTVPFDYLQRSFVRVTLFSATNEGKLTLGVDYNFVNPTTIETVTSYGGDDGWSRIQLRRYTDAERIVDFIDGSVLLADDLNIANLQAIHIAQEGRDISYDSLQPNLDESLDARGRRITRLGDAILDTDAVNLGQIKSWDTSAYNQAERARREADRAEAAGTSVITPLRRVKLRLDAIDFIDGVYQLPVMPVDVQVFLHGKILQHEALGNYKLSGSTLIINDEIMPWDFFIIYINMEILGYDESWEPIQSD